MNGYYKTLSRGNRVSFSSYIMDALATKDADILPVTMNRERYSETWDMRGPTRGMVSL